MENSKKNKMEKILNKFDEFCTEKKDEKDIEKCIEKDRQYLKGIGVERLKNALSTMSLTVLYGFLHKQGFKGDRARLIDLLFEIGVREKQVKPEKFNNYKCRVKGCDGRLVKVSKNDKSDLVYCCNKCKSFHKFENRKIVLIKQDVQENKENENKVIELKPVVSNKTAVINHAENSNNNSAGVSQKAAAVEKPVASSQGESFEGMFANGSKFQSEKKVAAGQSVASNMRIEEDVVWENKK